VAEIVTYEFPARGKMPPVKLTWYDGGIMPPRPEVMEPGRKMGDDSGGVLFIGSKGILMNSTYGRHPRLVPETKMKEYKRPEKTIPRSPGIHEEWIEAIKADKKSTTDFEYAGPLTEYPQRIPARLVLVIRLRFFLVLTESSHEFWNCVFKDHLNRRRIWEKRLGYYFCLQRSWLYSQPVTCRV
jgi:hypothetical protein